MESAEYGVVCVCSCRCGRCLPFVVTVCRVCELRHHACYLPPATPHATFFLPAFPGAGRV